MSSQDDKVRELESKLEEALAAVRDLVPAKLAVVVAVTETQLRRKRDALRQNPTTKAGQLDAAAKVGTPE